MNKLTEKNVGALVLLKIKNKKNKNAINLINKLIKKEKYAEKYEFYIYKKSIHLHEKYSNSDKWIKHIDHFDLIFDNQITNVFKIEKIFSYGKISSKLKAKLKNFGAINYSLLKAK
tara:strand:+ start:184 stop:531 length:348 start_codon:yes stop_codon:yes gene_type:complete